MTTTSLLELLDELSEGCSRPHKRIDPARDLLPVESSKVDQIDVGREGLRIERHLLHDAIRIMLGLGKRQHGGRADFDALLFDDGPKGIRAIPEFGRDLFNRPPEVDRKS